MSREQWLLNDLQRCFVYDEITLAELEDDVACILRGGTPDRYVPRVGDTVLSVMVGGEPLYVPLRSYASHAFGVTAVLSGPAISALWFLIRAHWAP